jgi:phosphoglycerate kinase
VPTEAASFAKRTVRDVQVHGKRVLVRVDFNVPLRGSRIIDDTRIRAALPTLNYLLERGARVIVCSHLGRPEGRIDARLSLRPCAERLAELTGRAVTLAEDSVGPRAEHAAADLGPGEVLMLENLRFHREEEQNDPVFARALASLGDVYVNDAFGTAHRAHASTEGVARHLPAIAGFLMEKELRMLSGLLHQPARPFLAIVGGAKVSSKIGVLEAMVRRVDTLAIGGAMANTFLIAAGHDVGRSLAERDQTAAARRVLDGGKPVIVPVDVVVAPSLEASEGRAVTVGEPIDGVIADIGPRSLERIGQEISRAKTIFWNGPLGFFENRAFGASTRRVAELMAKANATTVVGGGESVQAVEEAGLARALTHVSTGGGASLELLEGKELPGVKVLQDA